MIRAGRQDRNQLVRSGLALLVLTAAMILIPAVPIRAQFELTLYDREPFDQLVLTREFGSVEVPVFVLPPVVRELASPAPAQETLRVRLIDYPERLYDIQWGDIARVETFEDLLLKEANRLARNGKLDEAFRCLDRLQQIAPDWPGLDAGVESFLFLDAAAAFRSGRLDEALTVLDEIQRRDPGRKGLSAAMVRVAGQVFTKYFASGSFRSAWHTIDWAKKRVTDDEGVQAIEGWERQLKETARGHLGRAKTALAARDFRTALLHTENAQRVWPTNPEVSSLSATIRRAYPRVVVGVTRRGTADPGSTHDWGYRRFQRLTSRRLVEVRGYYADGLKYQSPLGTMTRNEDEQGLDWLLPPERLVSFSAYDLATFVRRIGAEDVQLAGLWNQLAPTLSVEGAERAHLRVARPLLRWSHVLHVPVVVGGSGTDSLTPYNEFEQSDQQMTVVANPDYLLKQKDQPSEIVERHFDSYQQLIEELRSGSLDAVDRVGPDEVRRLANTPGLLVEQYLFPSVHFLVPNTTKPLMASRTFRRALLYGISRSTILQQDLLGGEKNKGCQVISAPLPIGAGGKDPLAYAYDTSVPPREYDPALAITLATMERRRLIKPDRPGQPPTTPVAQQPTAAGGPPASDSEGSAAEAGSTTDSAADDAADSAADSAADTAADTATDDESENSGEDESQEPAVPKYDPLVIVYPDDPLAHDACQAIVRYLEAVGIECQPQALPPGVSRPENDDWDLWYTDVVMMEPIVDVQRLFGVDGVLTMPSPYVNLALGDLARATRWTDARDLLHEIHQMLHRELPVLPLWQMTDYCIFRRDIQGRSRNPVTFYQDVESWRLVPQGDLADLP